MEAASRPKLEPLSELPVEELMDGAESPKEPPVVSAAARAAHAPAATESRTPEQTGLNFVDPDMFLAAEPTPPAPAVANAAPASQSPARTDSPAAQTDDTLALTLEDPVVDEMLTQQPPPAPPPKAVAADPAELSLTAPPGAAAASAPRSSTDTKPSDTRSARVPIAKTASLTAAATKLAAASAAAQQRTSVKVGPRPVPPVVAPPRQPAAAATPAPPKKVEVPGAISDLGARAAATPPKVPAKPAAATAPPRPAPAPTPAKSAAPKAAVTAPAAASTTTTAAATPAASLSPPMDRDFVARNQVVERYLSGRLPLKGATEFERFCHEHPELLDQIGLAERVNAGLRLLEASGKPEPWQESKPPVWQNPLVTIALAAGVAVLAAAMAIVALGSAGKGNRIVDLQKQVIDHTLDPATSTREIRLLPNREGATSAPAIIISGTPAQLIDLKIDESRSQFHSYRVTMDRVDQGRMMVITNLTKDSNGLLRLTLNSSALGPGNYQMTIEGINWRGDFEADSWLTIGIQR